MKKKSSHIHIWRHLPEFTTKDVYRCTRCGEFKELEKGSPVPASMSVDEHELKEE